MELGDTIAAALAQAGITKERVERWLGGPCGCASRQARLNQLGRWATALLRGDQSGPPPPVPPEVPS